MQRDRLCYENIQRRRRYSSDCRSDTSIGRCEPEEYGVCIRRITGNIGGGLSRRRVMEDAVRSNTIRSSSPLDSVYRADRFKASLQFRLVPYGQYYDALDACKVADYVVLALSPTVEVDDWADTLLRSLQAQGLPEVVSVIAPGPSMDPKSRSGIIKSLLSFMQYFVPTQSRVFDLNASSDRTNALRTLSEGKPGDPRWRDGRTWVLGESAEWEDGVLRVTGVVRGAPLSANRLIHLPNFGDYQISKVSISYLHTVIGLFKTFVRYFPLLYLVITAKLMGWILNRP